MMKNNNLENKYSTFEEIWNNPNILKIFKEIPNLSYKFDGEFYKKFIDLWKESSKYSGFFERDVLDTSKISNICFILSDYKSDKIKVNYKSDYIEFYSIGEMWKYFDDKKQNIVFYFNNFKNFVPKINSFFEKTRFIKNQKTIIIGNQWKNIYYKNQIDGYLLKRSKLEDNSNYEWKMFFLPSENKNINYRKKPNYFEILNKKIYLSALDILMQLIIAVYSKEMKNIDLFISELKNKIGYYKNEKLKKIIDRKIDYIFNNKSESKCLRAIIWISILKVNEDQNTIQKWALKKNKKIKKNTIVDWVECAIEDEEENEEEWKKLINRLKIDKKIFIEFIKDSYKDNNFLNKKIVLLPRFILDFQKISINESCYSIIGGSLLNVYFDENILFDQKYLWKSIGLYILEQIKYDRDLDAYKINKIIILNAMYMQFIEIDIQDLLNFYKDNFGIELKNIKRNLRRSLNF